MEVRRIKWEVDVEGRREERINILFRFHAYHFSGIITIYKFTFSWFWKC
jgi:hypothetical protein